LNTIRIDSERARLYAARMVQELPIDGSIIVEIKKYTRTIGDNQQQWPILNAFSEQLLWPVNGVNVKLSPEDWKNVLTAAYRNETGRVAQGFDGGMVFLGHKTSKFSKKEWPLWMEYLNWASAEKGVKIPASKSMLRSLGIDDD